MIDFWKLLDEIISPRGLKCLCCDELSYGELLCSSCNKALKAIRLDPSEASSGDLHSVYRYDGVAKSLVVQLKEDCLEAASEVLAEEMAQTVKELQLPENTIMTWVTMPELRRRKRGIDHGKVICEAVSNLCGLKMKQLLTRTGKVRTQRGLNREKRLKNLTGTFKCDVSLTGPVLLVDDVLTTGATAAACAEALTKAGATRVIVLTATKAAQQRSWFEFGKAGLYGLYTS